MSADWHVGDVALCNEADFELVVGHEPASRPRKPRLGERYLVVDVYHYPREPIPNVWLRLSGFNHGLWAANQFRKAEGNTGRIGLSKDEIEERKQDRLRVKEESARRGELQKEKRDGRLLIITRLHEQGSKLSKIGRELGISTKRVRQILSSIEKAKSVDIKRESSMNIPAIDWPIDNLPLSARAANCLINEGITTVRDLVSCTAAHLLRCPNFGHKSLKEIEDILEAEGLWLRSDEQ